MKQRKAQNPSDLASLPVGLEQLIALAEQARSGIAIIQDDIVRYVNPSLAAMWGGTVREGIGTPYADYIHPADFSSAVEADKGSPAGKKGRSFQEARMRCKDGSTAYVELEVGLLTYGRKPATVVLVHDITDHKRAEDALRDSEEKYRSLVESTEDSVYLVDKDGTYLFMNNRYRSRLGQPMDKVIGREYGDFHSQDEKKVFSVELDNVFETARSRQCEHKSRRDGKYFLRTLSPVKDADGRVIAATVISKDITKLKETEEALKESEERYRLLFERNLAGIYRSTLDGRFLDCNKAFAQIFGYDAPEEILSLQASELHFAPADREAFITELRKQGTLTHRECRLRRKDGSPVWVLENASVIEEEENVPAFVQGTLIDITERKRMAMRLQRSLMGAIAALAAITEIRDPYTAGHQERVTRLAHAIVKEMGLPQTTIEVLRVAGKLHDIGKVCVPAEILSKPSALTAAEFELVKGHPRVAHDILKRIGFPWPVAEIVLQHHERLDGSGYPLGITGDKILLEAKILAVADVVEAMASHRPYRSALGIEKTLEEISKSKGILYASEVVDACLRLFRERSFRF